MRDENQRIVQTYGRVIPSLAFYHIPTHAMRELQMMKNINPIRNPGLNMDMPMDVQKWPQSRPFIEAINNMQGLIATFSGHDHGNDWCHKWNEKVLDMTGNGVNLCFSRHTGYGGYSDWIRGSRQILLNLTTLDKEIKTWTRLEDGTIEGSVVLNSTFGEDVYPRVTHRRTHVPKRY